MDLRDLLNIKYPIIQGGMANIADHHLASAVSNAGGLGLIGCGGWDTDRVREEVRKTKALTDKPFGVNIMLMSPYADALSDLVIEEGIKVVTTGAGSPGVYMKKWKEAGIIVIPVVPSVAFAIRLERSGADALIVEGTEAGGHIGEITTFVLVPQVADAVNIPVIAAGGIADHRGLDAAFILGAKGVQIGTVLLASEECPIHQNYKEKVVKAKDTETVVTGRQTGAPVRVLKNRMAKEYLDLTKYGDAKLEDLEKLTLGSLRKAVFDGDLDNGSFMAGQSAGLVKAIRPVKEILEDIFENSLVAKGVI
ncbi:MAG: enoyl-[acyl-carrier-protein] reductase FabK [Candidatus Izemoplasmatales bacterium]|jgi:enoyl-[acyl-carrier protein] reductase II|nr:enoyl-[acyl-carrier-protein] reductase FabK [Candidatus Izemoplasmatales bacterium]